MTRYMRWLAEERGLEFEDYESLWRWSATEIEAFWTSIWDFFEVEASAPHTEVLPDRAMPGADWFPGARLSYPQHIFRNRDDADVAVRHASELRELAELTWGELRDQVAGAAAGLRALGVERGDRVVAYMPNIPETLVAFLATASLGAIWSSCSPDFGASSVVDRFAQIEPKVLFCVDGYRYNGRDFDRTDVVAGLQTAMPTLERTVVLPYLAADPDLEKLDRAITWDELLASGEGAALEFEQVPFDHPLWVLYSSAPPGCRRRSSRARAGSCSST